ncbi:MAG: hypothetical protein HKM89_06405 [Gemmatimonadales bacterium]|nr:hypothetical protein [Gemmatimonadales bacterium]
MSHPEEGMLHALLDGELTPDEVRTIEAHVAACAACTARLAEARAIFDESNLLVDRLEMPEPKPADSIRPAVIPLAPTKRRIAPQRLRTLAWAATILIATGVGYAVGDWRHRIPGQEAESFSFEDQVAPMPEASAEGASRVAPSSDLERAEPVAVEGAVETETAPSVAKQLRVGGEAGPAEQPAGRANEAQAVPAAPAAAPVDAVQLEERGAGVPSRAAVVGGAEAEARARRDQLAQEAAEDVPAKDKDVFAENRPAPPVVGALRAGDSVAREQVVTGAFADRRHEAEVDNAKAAPADTLRAQQAEGFRARVTPARTATLEEAVQVLNGAIRLVEGASLSRVEIAAPPNVPWAAVESSLVRVVYQLDGAEVVLGQVRVNPTLNRAVARAARRGVDAPADAPTEVIPVPQLAAGDTLFAREPGGGHRVWWLDGPSRLLSLSGSLGQDALWRIVRRIR